MNETKVRRPARAARPKPRAPSPATAGRPGGPEEPTREQVALRLLAALHADPSG